MLAYYKIAVHDLDINEALRNMTTFTEITTNNLVQSVLFVCLWSG
jgi:hypothetical protein